MPRQKNGAVSKRKMVSLSANEWEPKKKGDKFGGVVCARRLVETKFGWKPVIEIASEATGEVIGVFASNIKLAKLAFVPEGGYVELTFHGMYKAKVGRKMQELRDISAEYDASVKLLSTLPAKPENGKAAKGKK